MRKCLFGGALIAAGFAAEAIAQDLNFLLSGQFGEEVRFQAYGVATTRELPGGATNSFAYLNNYQYGIVAIPYAYAFDEGFVLGSGSVTSSGFEAEARATLVEVAGNTRADSTAIVFASGRVRQNEETVIRFSGSDGVGSYLSFGIDRLSPFQSLVFEETDIDSANTTDRTFTLQPGVEYNIFVSVNVSLRDRPGDPPPIQSQSVRLSALVDSAPCSPADVDGNDGIDVFDLITFLQNFDPTATCPADTACAVVDIDGNDAIDVFDLIAFLQAFDPSDPNCPGG